MRIYADDEIEFYANAYAALGLERLEVTFDRFISAPFAVCRLFGQEHPAWARENRTSPTAIAKRFDDRDQITVAPHLGIALHRRHERQAAMYQGGEDATFA